MVPIGIITFMIKFNDASVELFLELLTFTATLNQDCLCLTELYKEKYFLNPSFFRDWKKIDTYLLPLPRNLRTEFHPYGCDYYGQQCGFSLCGLI